MNNSVLRHKNRERRPIVIDDSTILDYQTHRVGAALPWDHARRAVRASWAKLSQDIGPRDFGRGIRSGF